MPFLSLPKTIRKSRGHNSWFFRITGLKNWFRFNLCLHSHSSHQANAHYFISELCRKVQIAQLTIVCLREKLLLKVMVISISELELSIKLRVSLGSGSDPRDCSVLFWKRMPEKNASDSPMNLSFFPSSRNIWAELGHTQTCFPLNFQV